MKKTVIRSAVFETNSSSTHSICIASGEFVADRIPVEDGVCRVYPGEFGWEVEDYTDAPSKASYCLTWCKMGSNPGYLEMLTNVLQKETGASVIEFVPSTGFWEWGYIDHQSDYVCAAAFESEEALRQFIFNPSSTLHTDNDNG